MAISIIFTLHLYKMTLRHPDQRLLHYALKFWILFKLPYIWIMMTFLRTHFVIDMTSGVVCGFIFTQAAEKISVLLDVYLRGLGAKSRDLLFYSVCPGCGWAIDNALAKID